MLKWGEQELVRRMEDREPNILSHTVHSVTRKGVKKRDLSDIELREILSELLPLVRMDHVLPPNNEILMQVNYFSSLRHRLLSVNFKRNNIMQKLGIKLLYLVLSLSRL